MGKKISILIIVTIVLVTGYISVKKLNYWERTVMLFKLNSSGQSFGGRGERGQGGFEGQEGFGRRPGVNDGNLRRGRANVPDSMRIRFEGRGDRSDGRIQNRQTGLPPGMSGVDSTALARGSFNGRMRNPEGRGVRGLSGRNPVNLSNVIYFLSAFAFFTVIVIYLEKVFYLITRRKQS